jgi:hypothetical protein
MHLCGVIIGYSGIGQVFFRKNTYFHVTTSPFSQANGNFATKKGRAVCRRVLVSDELG